MTQTTGRRTRAWRTAAAATGILTLAGCSGVTDDPTSDTGTDTPASGFTAMIMQSNDGDDYYEQMLQKFADDRGIDVEVIYYPGDAYNTQVTTQLQAGNAADIMILAPGTGQAVSVVTLAEAGFLEPLGDTAAATIPQGTENQFGLEGEVYGQPTGLVPVGMVYNATAADDAGISEFPASYDDLLDACSAARDAGKSFAVIAGSVPGGAGLFAQIIAATRVYETTPDWNEQRTNGDVTFADSEGWRETLEDIAELSDAGCLQDGAAAGDFSSITTGLSAGTALTAPLPGGAAQSIGSAANVELSVHAFPSRAGAAQYMNISANYAWSLNAKASDGAKASAKEFLAWIAQPAEAVEFADLAGLVPISGASADELLPQFTPIADILDAGTYAPLPNTMWPDAAVYDALGVGVQGIITGQRTPDDVLQAMDAAWP